MRMLLPLALGALLAACASQRTNVQGEDFEILARPGFCRGAGQGANEENCAIRVDARVNSDGTCSLKVDPSQDLVSFKSGAAGKWIFWEIKDETQPLRFTKDPRGVRFSNDKDGNFSTPKWEDGGLTYRWKNRNGSGDAGDYKYDVEVSAAGVRCPPLDPVIRNL